MAGLSLEDGAATLASMTASGIARACEMVPQAPKRLLVTGGGRANSTLMSMIAHATGKQAVPVEDMMWDGDALEAQAFAYLAARSMQALALTLPSTTEGSSAGIWRRFLSPAARAGGT
ncbi:MAG: anhydro-N-acetylmuramic acid kinase [Alphaproteobacteria bacterium]